MQVIVGVELMFLPKFQVIGWDELWIQEPYLSCETGLCDL